VKILLTGASGQLGRELTPLLTRLGSLTRVDRDVLPGDSGMLRRDLGEPQSVRDLLDEIQPDLVVNAAAYTAVDAAEDHPETAFLVNEELPANLAGWAAANDAFVVHFSTDYVFPGNASRPYRESDPTAPLNVYGDSKLAGELAVTSSGCRHLVVRTSWVYSSHGNNFVLTMLRLGAERPALGIVDDQLGCPTWARNLAAASCLMLEKAMAAESAQFDGLYHYSDGDEVSWFGFAREIFAAAKELGLLDTLPELSAVTSAEFPQKATRPAYSVLDVTRALKVFGIERPGLRSSLQQCLGDLQKLEQ
jgi:dTDP-4-dehydrorhamnose reductase